MSRKGPKGMWGLLILAPLVGLVFPVVAAEKPSGDPEVIVEKNLFHPSRSVPAPPPPAPKPRPVVTAPAPPPPPKFILSGVAIHEEVAMALLQEPALTQNKPVLIMRGDVVGSYRLTDVKADRVTLESPTNTLTVLLFDPSKPRPAAVGAALALPRAPRVSTPESPGVQQERVEERRREAAARLRRGPQDAGRPGPRPGEGEGRGARQGQSARAGRQSGDGHGGAAQPAAPAVKPRGENAFLEMFQRLQQTQPAQPSE